MDGAVARIVGQVEHEWLPLSQDRRDRPSLLMEPLPCQWARTSAG
jgi:hypothetical protein